MNIRHSKATPRWGTPTDDVERARRVMGAIDLDPCSESTFQSTVRADQHYSLTERGEDALVLPWHGRVYCNPPGGAVRKFWLRALSQPIEQMIWMGFSVEQLCILADEDPGPLDFSCCILRTRVSFIRHDGYEGSPGHGNYVAGIMVDPAAFEREYGPLGKIVHGRFAGTVTARPG